MGANTALISILAALGFVLMFWVCRRHDTLGILQRDFAASQTPQGELLACQVRFPLAEMPTPIIAQATRAGWYMVTPPEEIAKWRWTNNTPFLRQPVFIPWSQLRYAPARFPMHRWIRFDVTGTRQLFFVPRDAAMTLLSAAGRSI